MVHVDVEGGVDVDFDVGVDVGVGVDVDVGVVIHGAMRLSATSAGGIRRLCAPLSWAFIVLRRRSLHL